MFKVFRSSGIEGSYSVSSNPLFESSGWMIYPAKHRTTKKKASVWQFNKKDYENRLLQTGVINRSNKQLVLNDIYDSLRKYIANLTKFKHPNMLTVIEPLEEHKNRWLFVTEYVVNDLASLPKADIEEIIVTKGMLQVATGLKFLHQSVSTVHLNLRPNSVLITENFDWKISGLQFMQQLENGAVAEKYIDPMDERLPLFLSVDFKFSSPNLLLKHNVDFIDDLFSMACLIYYLFNNGHSMIECSNSSLLDYERSVKKLNHNLQQAESNPEHAFFARIPENYKSTFFDLLRRTQESSSDVIELSEPYTVDELINSSIFNNDLIKVLNVADNYDALDNSEKINFLSGLRNQIQKFPKALLINKFVPILEGSIRHYIKSNTPLQNEDEQIIALSIENLLLLSEPFSQLTFTDKVYPVLKDSLDSLDLDSVRALLISHIDVIQNKLGLRPSSSDSSRHYQNFQQLLMQLFDQSLAHASALPSSIRLQETLLSNLTPFLEYEPYTVITNRIFPAIGNLFSTTTSLKVKILTIKAMILMIDGVEGKGLDNYTIAEKLLPLAHKTQPSNLRNADLLAEMFALYRSIYSKLKGTQGTISVGGEEVSVSDLVLESVFFEVWRLSKYVRRRSDMDQIFVLLGDMETYLRGVTKSRVASLPAEPEPQASSPSVNADDDFGDFEGTTTPAPQIQPSKPKATPLKLEKTRFGATSEQSSYTPMKARPQNEPRPVQVPQAPKSMAELMAEKSGQTSSQPSIPSMQTNNTSTMSYMQPMKVTRGVSRSPTPQSSQTYTGLI